MLKGDKKNYSKTKEIYIVKCYKNATFCRIAMLLLP